MAFFLIFSVYLFIYLKQSKQKQVEATTFIYLCTSLVVRHGFRFNIQCLFIYLFIQSDVKKSSWKRRPFYYRPQRSWGKVMFLHPQLVAATETRTVGKRAVRILLQCLSKLL